MRKKTTLEGRRSSTQELMREVAWQKAIETRVHRWAVANRQGPMDDVARAVVRRRVQKLLKYVNWYIPDPYLRHDKPFSTYDAAALVVLPKRQAQHLLSRLGIGPADEEDLTFNMNWFRPQGFR